MITKEIVEKAIDTAHDACEKDCIHAAPFREADMAMIKFMNELLTHTMCNPQAAANPPLYLVFAGIHVGYRLRELETSPIPKGELN